MKEIQMLDLSGQYHKIQQEIDEAMKEVIHSTAFINGPAVARFAGALAESTGAKYAIPCGNCTDALQISLMALDLKPGDEVIIPAFTYVAAAEAAVLLGLVPVFADVDPLTYNIDVESIRKRLTPKTKAILPVHLFGQAADMEPILKIACEKQLFVIEDAAQSIGAVYTFSNGTKKQCGTMGDVGCLSFFPSKNLGCFGDGGAMLTNDPVLAERLKRIASHGQSVKYRHEIVGCNSRLDTLQAAILQVKLKYLEDYNAARQKAAAYYSEHLADLSAFLQLPVEAPFSTHVYHQFTIQVKHGKRDALKKYLQEKGVPTMIYYPLSLPGQPVFRKKEDAGNSENSPETGTVCMISAQLPQEVISLPMHTELDEEQLSFIVTQIKIFFS